ncbi:zinc-dependent metalloprotease [Chitinophaga nivalis]|uniref:Zinc-dependent metalloprotease n=1 Tax=Chitinophaga nivalis TaxID=2991709 RepID=A0ABT3IRE2_9BACT|nr:zinc-dependent metalloprotease [Chitinophaga nivalis]MCW3463985.1 zinc-dependent metalloprotease [Chitinophaga nivalis]MCW3486325.1 zinc-dependent metalloprotease [Chitinophaga nivalis]
MKMFKHSLVVCLCASALFVSCKKEEAAKESTPAVSKETLAQIKSLGFSDFNVQKIDGGYLVENDIFLGEQQLKTSPISTVLSIAKVEQYRTYNLVTGLPRTITIGVSGLNANFQSATQQMVNAYNALGLRLRFQYVGTSGADIVIYGSNLGGGVLGYSGFPSGGNPYPQVVMNTGGIFGTNVAFMRKVIQHEVGHCIGFRHTDWFNRGYSCGSGGAEPQNPEGAVQIPGTPSGADAGSWMLACTGANGSSFNGNDVTALRYLYQ